RIIYVHQRKTVLLELVEFVLKFHGEPVRNIRSASRIYTQRRLSIRSPHDSRKRGRPVAEFVRWPASVQRFCTVAPARLLRLLNRECILRTQRQEPFTAVRQLQR